MTTTTTTAEVLSCNSLSTRASFADFIADVEGLTDGNFSAAGVCRAEICGALWGYGNADVDGVGMVVGYCMANVLGFLLALALLLVRNPRWMRRLLPQRLVASRPASSTAERDRTVEVSPWRWVFVEVFKAHYASALLLAFSIQVAATITLARLNFGLSANGMGDTSARITWAVSIVTMIPLLYLPFLPQLCSEDVVESSQTRNNNLRVGAGKLHQGDEKSPSAQAQAVGVGVESEEVKSGKLYDREDFDFFLYLGCWMLSLYPFVSRIISLYGETQVGQGRHAVISPTNFTILTAPCFEQVEQVNDRDHLIMTGFGIFTSGLILVMTVIKVGGLVVQWWGFEPASSLYFLAEIHHRLVHGKRPWSRATRNFGTACLMLGLPPLAGVQFWTIGKLQAVQWQMAKAMGQQDQADQWTFGQVVSLTIFVPVFTHALFVWRQRRKAKR